ncbi:Hypothetical predicted protein, partial [Olea europaea subsp. europaea]
YPDTYALQIGDGLSHFDQLAAFLYYQIYKWLQRVQLSTNFRANIIRGVGTEQHQGLVLEIPAIVVLPLLSLQKNSIL